MNQRSRCAWAQSPLAVAYHDLEWGVPVHEDDVLFEFLTLEGAQAGLSWETILRKRARYRELFARLRSGRGRAGSRRRASSGCCRIRASCATASRSLSTVSNAKAFLAVQDECGSFDAYVWQFVGGAAARESLERRSTAFRRRRRSRMR